MANKQYLKELKEEHRRLVADFDWLLHIRQDYIDYFKKYGAEAEDKYYGEQLWESGYDSEGLFSLHHKSLKSKIEENKEERKKLTEKIKELKTEIKRISDEKD